MYYESDTSHYSSNAKSFYPSPYLTIEQNRLHQQYAVHRNRRDIIGHIERVAKKYMEQKVKSLNLVFNN